MKAVAAVALFAFAVFPAAAQNTGLQEINDGTMVPALGMTADAAEDLDVYVDGAKVGEVEDVRGTDPATPTALVVDFSDGTQFSDADRIIPLDKFTYANRKLTLNASAQQVAAMPKSGD